MIKKQCISCQTTLSGSYCHMCGEKVVESKDFALRKIVGEGFGAFTNLDSRIFKSFKALLFQPGLLCNEYIRGARKAYLKPFQIFIICNILFFIFLNGMDILLIPAQWFIIADFEFFGLNVEAIAQSIANKKGVKLKDITLLYDANVASNSKLFVILLAPLFALVTYPIGYKKLKEYGKHIILALNLVSFFLILSIVWVQFFSTLLVGLPKSFFLFSISFVYILYTILTFRKVFEDAWWKAILKGLYFFVFLFIIVFTYRFLVSYYTLVTL